MKCLKCNRAFDEELLINTEIGLVCGQCIEEELGVKADNKLDRTCDVCGKETGVLVVEGERQVCTECLEGELLKKLSIEKIEIKDKIIYTFEHHNLALLPWSIYRKSLSKPPILITLDYHTDTIFAFRHYIYTLFGHLPYKDFHSKSENLISKINFNDLNSIEWSALYLNNDEHIQASLLSNVISEVFGLTYIGDSSRNKKIHLLFKYDSYEKEDINKAIEFNALMFILDEIKKFYPNIIKNNVITSNYILDIDCDYFLSQKSLKPKDIRIFYNLIKNAGIITIAKESSFVSINKENHNYEKKNKNFDSQFILDELLQHIENALA